MFTIENYDKEHNLRNQGKICLNHHNTTFFEKHLNFNATKLFNNLPLEIQKETKLNIFKKKLINLLMTKEYYSVKEYFNDKLNTKLPMKLQDDI